MPKKIERVLLACFFLSGLSSLTYEVTWTRKLVLIFGSTTFAVATILSVFMGGLAAGCWIAGRLASRIERGPVVYGALELAIGVYGFLVPGIFSLLFPAYRAAVEGLGTSFERVTAIRVVLATAVLIFPTTLMGATLPILATFYRSRLARLGADVGRLYAVNTLGAVAGTFLSGFVFLPCLGVARTILLAGTINAAIGTVMILVGRKHESEAPADQEKAPPSPAPVAVLLAFAFSGFAAMICEVGWTRGLSMVVGSTVYAFSTMLTIFLLGLASGSWAFARWSTRIGDATFALAALFAAAGVCVVGGLYLWNALPAIAGAIVSRWPIGVTLLPFVASAIVIFPPTFFLGGVFPLALRAHGAGKDGAAALVGKLGSANTLGAILGSALAGFAIVPVFQLQGTLMLAAGLEVATGVTLALIAYRNDPKKALGFAGAAAILAGVPLNFVPKWQWETLAAWDFLSRPAHATTGVLLPGVAAVTTRSTEPDEPLLSTDGPAASVLVARQDGITFLAINGRINASDSGDMATQILIAQAPLLLARKIEKIAIVGHGSGVTTGSALGQPGVRDLRSLEMERAVVDGSAFFGHVNGHPLEDPRCKLAIDDGRNYLLVSREKFDAIISEPSHPWVTGVSNLFTKDFFELERDRLADGGVAAQWIQTYQLSLANVRALVRTFRSVFPHVVVFSSGGGADLVLVGSAAPLDLEAPWVAERMAAGKAELSRIGIAEAADLERVLLLKDEDCDRFAGPGPLNTDDEPLVEFSGPFDLRKETSPENQAALLQARRRER